MTFDAAFLQALLDAEDPLGVVWERMLSLYQVAAYPEDVVAFYNEREATLNQFEEALYHGYFEIYDLLLERAQQQDGGYVRQRLQGDTVVIIADSLSVREVGLLRQRLNERDWQVSVAGFAVAPFPTLTESLAEKLLGTNPASGRDAADFGYCYVAGPSEVPNLPLGEPTLVWLRLPDKELEQVTVAQATTVADAFNATVETLARLLEQAAHRDVRFAQSRPVIITSDHGYLYATAANHYWSLPAGIEGAARRVFSRESRARPLTREGATALPSTEPREQSHFAFSSTYVGIRGRFWWASASVNDHCTGHGGLSLVESLVPIFSVVPIS